MTAEALKNLPDSCRIHLGLLKSDYSNDYKKDETRVRISSYLEALRDSGVITEVEKRALFCYYTL